MKPRERLNLGDAERFDGEGMGEWRDRTSWWGDHQWRHRARARREAAPRVCDRCVVRIVGDGTEPLPRPGYPTHALASIYTREVARRRKAAQRHPDDREAKAALERARVVLAGIKADLGRHGPSPVGYVHPDPAGAIRIAMARAARCGPRDARADLSQVSHPWGPKTASDLRKPNAA